MRDKEEMKIVKKVNRLSQGKGKDYPASRQPQKLIEYTKIINKDTIVNRCW